MNYYPNLSLDYIGATGEHSITDYIDLTSNQLNDKINNISFTSVNSNIDNLRYETYHINSNNPLAIVATKTYSGTPHTYIINSNMQGEIRFNTYFSFSATDDPINNYAVKIDNFGKLYVYHKFNLLQPTFPAGWYDIEGEVLGLKNQGLIVDGTLAGLGTFQTVATGQINLLQSLVATLKLQADNLQYQIEMLGFLTGNEAFLIQGSQTFEQLVDRMNNLALSMSRSYTNTISAVGTVGVGLGTPLILSAITDFFNRQYYYNLASNFSNAYLPSLTTEQRRILYSCNDIPYLSNTSNYNYYTCNLGLYQGFINSNVITNQFIPRLKSNKVMLGNITTPNSSYQLEMTGDINTNMLYINSTSLTSLLNQKQNNLTAVSPIYITTGNIGINYDSTLILTAGVLGVSIAAESKWGFTGGNIYNKAMTNVGIGTDSGLTYKLNVVGDSYFSSNVNIATPKLNFIGAYSGQSAFALATGTNEYYIEFNSGGGTLILNEPCACDILIVGAGGNGGTGASSGGGGAGEVIYYPNFPLRSGTLNVQVGASSTNTTNRISRIYPTSGNEIMRALGGGNGGSWVYSTSGGSVSALTYVDGSSDAYIIISAGTTTLTLNSNTTVDILVIGGGGGGASRDGGGGGAGALIYKTNYSLSSGEYTITIGAGGAGATGLFNYGSGYPSNYGGATGSDTTIVSGGTTIFRAKGGGGGAFPNVGTGGVGGCNGGNTAATTAAQPDISNQNIPQDADVFGNKGGVAATSSPNPWATCGGGGAGGVGLSQTMSGSTITKAGDGGIGKQISITGTNTYYAGGGGGGCYGDNSITIPAGTGGLGGGGNGSRTGKGTKAGNGTANTGSGGGGGGIGPLPRINGNDDNGEGGDGGSGVVIIRFKNYSTLITPTSGGSGGGGSKNQTGAVAGTKFDDYKSLALAGLNGTSTNGGNGGSGSSLYNTRFTSTITGTSLSVALGGSGATASPATPTVKTNYGDGGDGNGGVGAGGIVIIRFKEASSHLHLKAIKDNANTGIILDANETVSGTTTPYQLRIFPWSDTYTNTGVVTRGWSFRTHDGLANQDLINLFSYFGGRIGIKTKNPSAVLDVNGDIQCKTFNIIGNEQYGVNCQIVNQNAIGEASFGMYAGQATTYGGLAFYYLPTDNLGYISCSKSFKIKTGNDAANSYIYIDNTNGYVGIGITNPATKLGVNGMITANDLQINNGINATIISAGQIYGTGIDTNLINNLNGTITNVNNLFTSNIYIKNAIDMQNKNILNCGYVYGGANWANEWKAYTNYYHKDDQGRDRIYFKNDTGAVPNHFTLFKSGGTTHSFSDKDDVQYCLLERFGITTYFEVISGGGYDNIGVADGVSTGTYVFRKMYLRLSTFTEVHRCFIEDELYLNYDDFINEFVGRIVVSKGKIKTALKEADKDWQILEGKDGITIDDSHPVIELSRKKKDKAVIGVITKRNQNADMPNRLVINSLGETAIWVINSNGSIENGDLITTSDEIGYAERQVLEASGDADDIMRNYTIGKCMIDCNFELDNPNYKCEVIDEARDLKRAFLPIFIYSG